MRTRKTWPLSAVGSSEGKMPPQNRTGREEEQRRFDGLHTRRWLVEVCLSDDHKHKRLHTLIGT